MDDPGRFTGCGTLAAHYELTPQRYRSGEMGNAGSISKAGDADFGTATHAAASTIMMRSVDSSELEIWGLPLMRRKSRPRAVVLAARELSVMMHGMLAENTGFRHRPLDGVT